MPIIIDGLKEHWKRLYIKLIVIVIDIGGQCLPRVLAKNLIPGDARLFGCSRIVSRLQL